LTTTATATVHVGRVVGDRQRRRPQVQVNDAVAVNAHAYGNDPNAHVNGPNGAMAWA
jgi:hypothetical protein